MLSGTSKWLLPDYILHLHLYSNFKVYSPLTLILFILIDQHLPKVLKKSSFFLILFAPRKKQ